MLSVRRIPLYPTFLSVIREKVGLPFVHYINVAFIVDIST